MYIFFPLPVVFSLRVQFKRLIACVAPSNISYKNRSDEEKLKIRYSCPIRALLITKRNRALELYCNYDNNNS